MFIVKLVLGVAMLALLGSQGTFAADACSLLNSGEIESALKAKVTSTVPSSVGPEAGCIFKLDEDQVILSYYTDPNVGPKAKSIKEDPFVGRATGSNIKDYGNFGCHIINAEIVFSTNCNRYQPRWLHIAVQVHKGPAVPMDVVKGLLEKAASRFK